MTFSALRVLHLCARRTLISSTRGRFHGFDHERCVVLCAISGRVTPAADCSERNVIGFENGVSRVDSLAASSAKEELNSATRVACFC